MPAKSKAQFRFMAARAAGKSRDREGPTRAEAREFMESTGNYGALPERKSKPGRSGHSSSKTKRKY